VLPAAPSIKNEREPSAMFVSAQIGRGGRRLAPPPKVYGEIMTKRYPGRSKETSMRIQRARLRYAYTGEYHTRHLMREMKEAAQAKIAAFRESDPEGYERLQAKAKAKRAEAERQGADTPASPAAGTGLAAASGSVLKRAGAAFSGAGMGALATGAVLLASGAGTAAVVNHTVLKDEPSLGETERESRAAGRSAGYAGAAIGTVGTLAAIGGSGTVAGLSGAGIASGISAIGGIVGGSTATGCVIVAAAPAAVAFTIGYGVYRAVKWIRTSGSGLAR